MTSLPAVCVTSGGMRTVRHRAPAKQCTGPCGQVKPLTEFHRNADHSDGRAGQCRTCYNARKRRVYDPERAHHIYLAHHEQRLALSSAYYYEHHEQELARKRQYVAEHRDQEHERSQQWLADLRLQVFDHYGWVCRCCGTEDDLTIDHVNGDGRQHREELAGRNCGSAPVYQWLIRNGFPEGFRTLCRPCNSSAGGNPAENECRLNHA